MTRSHDHHDVADDSSELQRLRDENDGLRRRVMRLARDNRHLESRVERLEDSVVFRSLRRIGHAFGTLRSRLQRAAGLDPQSGDGGYANWARETDLFDSIGRARCGATSGRLATVSFLIDGQAGDPDLLKRTLSSVLEQRCIEKEIFVCGDASFPDAIRPLPAGIEPVVGTDFRESIRRALETARGEFVALVGPGAILEPNAAQAWLSAVDDDTAAVSSDWDRVNSAGQRHSPQFTPGLSPELLLRTMYWGRCFLARAAEIRKLDWPCADASCPLEHDLALRLTDRRIAVARVPRMLWHVQDGARGEDLNPAAVQRALERRDEAARAECAGPGGPVLEIRRPPCAERASIVICSRSPKLLDRCLASLRGTLDARHEVIVVAHCLARGSVRSAELERVAARHGARSVAYHGAFHFGWMNQLGVSASTGSVLVLLNDDVRPLRRDWLEAMLSQAVRRDVGAVGALLLYPDGSIQHAGIVLGDSNVPAHADRFGHHSRYWPWLRITREVSAVTGACLAIRRRVWDELGGFDPHFPVNFNDVDLCLRAARRGYRTILEAGAVLTHDEAQTRKAVVRGWERELFWERWQDLQNCADPFFNPQLATPDEKIRLREPSL